MVKAMDWNRKPNEDIVALLINKPKFTRTKGDSDYPEDDIQPKACPECGMAAGQGIDTTKGDK